MPGPSVATWRCGLSTAGHDVSVVARGPHLTAIKSQGLALLEDETRTVAEHLTATDRIADLGSQDMVILALKAHQIAAVVDDLPGLPTARRPPRKTDPEQTVPRILDRGPEDGLRTVCAKSRRLDHKRCIQGSFAAQVTASPPADALLVEANAQQSVIAGARRALAS